MRSKITNLNVSEANYIFAHVLLELNKYEKFNNLFVTERNKLIDEICLEVINKVNKNEDDKEALQFEILAYKIPDKEKKKHPLGIINLKKPENFNDLMKAKYDKIISEIVANRMRG